MSSSSFESLTSQTSKRTVGVLIKLKDGFFTQLPDFEKPDDAALIGIFAKDLKPQLFEGYEKYFDAVFWFDIDDKCKNILNDRSQAEKILELPELEEIIAQIIQILPKDKINLITTEKQLIKSVCKIREKFEIPGPKIKDVENFLDKGLLKTSAKANGLPTLKFTILNLAKINSIKMESRRIVTEIQKFPIFYSPIIVGGNIGSGRIKNEEELKKFILQESKSVKKGCYLLEECMLEKDLTEFWVWCVLSADGKCIPYSCSFGKKAETVAEPQKAGDPMVFQAHPFNEECEKTFSKLAEFVQNVATALKPPGPNVFGINAFQRQSQTSDYLFKNVAFGNIGERETIVTYNDTKISHENVALSAFLNLKYTPKNECHESHRRLLWYPCVKGILQNHEEFTKMNSITSKLEYRWFIPAGQKMETATCGDDYMLYLTIENPDSQALEKDTEFIQKNFHPHVILEA